VMVWKSNFDCTAFADVRFDRNTTPGLQGVSSTSTAHLPYPPAASEVHSQVTADHTPR
ncbi:hypothetical protein NHX12_029881, partial [Muraenolepis orangiensis]